VLNLNDCFWESVKNVLFCLIRRKMKEYKVYLEIQTQTLKTLPEISRRRRKRKKSSNLAQMLISLTHGNGSSKLTS